MRIKVELDSNETIEDVESRLQKALDVKASAQSREKYADEYLNELEAKLSEQHEDLVNDILKKLTEAIANHIKVGL